MKILVPISQVPDTTAKIAFSDDTTLSAAGVAFIINPYDEWYALVRALELKEAGKAEKVSLLHVGPAANDATVRKGLAIGADDAFRVDGDGDAFYVANQIAKFVKDNGYDLVLAGKETISYNSSAVAGIVAGILDWNYVHAATQLDIDGNIALLEQDVEGGVAKLKAELPLVVSAAKGMAQQRIPNMRGIMAARTKALTIVPATDTATTSSVVVFKPSEGRKACVFFTEDTIGQLVETLRNEAKAF